VIYVASSWKNEAHSGVCRILEAAGLEVYDFKANAGFHWSEVDKFYKDWKPDEYIAKLNHPAAERGFQRDFEALERCDVCVLVLPCGRSAHLELGWSVGARKRTAILLNDEGDGSGRLAPSVLELLGWLGVKD
jgi:hypothetical protein